MVRTGVALFCLAALSAAASGQPAEAPHYLQVVTADGERHDDNPDRRELKLLGSELETSRLRLARSAVRMICQRPCPQTLPARRPARDVVHWEDGRRTEGTVFIHYDVVEQNGAWAGRLEDARIVELGAGRDARLVRSLAPTVVAVIWHDPWGGGRHAVFRQPWLTLSERALTIGGRPPFARGDNLRFIDFDTEHQRPGREAWAEVDTVVWRDGQRTTGAVTISDALVRQEGHRPRPLREVAYIELARRAAR